MTGSWPLPPPGRGWRQVDPALHRLGGLVEAEARQGGVRRVRWDPGHGASAVFEPSRRGASPLVVVEVTGDEVRRHGIEDDERLPGLRHALGGSLPERLAAALRQRVLGGSRHVVSYHPGSRCVLRWVLHTPTGRRTVYTKFLPAGGAERYRDVSAVLAAAGKAQGFPALVPAVHAVWADLGAVVTSPARGPSASSRLGNPGLPAAVRERLAHDLGALLAAVQSAPVAAAPPMTPRRPEDDLAEARGYRPALWHAAPVVAPSLAALLEDLSVALPQSLTEVLAHGSFRPGQVVRTETRLTVLDLDSVGPADPARDVGHALAHLTWQGMRVPAVQDAVPALVRSLLEGYEDGGGKAGPPALAWWQAVTMAKLAGRRFRSLATAEWPLVPALLQGARDVLDPPATRTSRGDPLVRPELLDPCRVTRLLAPVLDGAARTALGTVTGTVSGAELLAEAAGRRAVLRYRFGSGASVVAKTYAEPERASITYRNLSALAAVGDGAGPPRPLGVLRRHGMVVYLEGRGRPLLEVPAGPAVDAARRAGRWLAALHRSDVGLERRLDLGREVANLAAWAAELARHDGGLAGPAHLLAGRLAGAAAALPPGLPSVPVHKDLHPGHLLVDGDGAITVIDVDEARMGDPAFDVAHMCTYLEELDQPWASEARRAFADGYGALPGHDEARRLGFYSAYARLKLAKQLARGTSRPWAGDDPGRLSLLLETGLACLDG